MDGRREVIYFVCYPILDLQLPLLWISAVSLKLTQTVVASQCYKTVPCSFPNHIVNSLFLHHSYPVPSMELCTENVLNNQCVKWKWKFRNRNFLKILQYHLQMTAVKIHWISLFTQIYPSRYLTEFSISLPFPWSLQHEDFVDTDRIESMRLIS